MFIQIKTQKNQTAEVQKERLAKLSSDYATCLGDDKCPCPKEEAAAAAKGKVLLQKKNTTKTCAVGEASCAQNCSRKVMDKVGESLKAKAAQPVKSQKKKQQLLQRDYSAPHYPIHSVAVGVFSKGAMNLDECLKFCLAATCGCDKAPGLDTIEKLFDAIKENDAANPGEKDFSHRVPA